MGEINFAVDNTALETVRNTQLNANFEEVEAAVKELVAPYRNAIVSEDGIANAKSDRARLHKVENNIDDYRKTVKRIYTEPLTKFEDKCKRISALCKEASRNLDIQIKAFEMKVKEQKKAELENHFVTTAGGYADYISFDEIFNERWLNATYSFETAKSEIDSAIAKTAGEVNCIVGLASPYEKTLLTEYTKNKNLAKIIQLNTQLAEQAKAEEERLRKKLEAEKQAAIEAAKREIEQANTTPSSEPVESVPVGTPIEVLEKNSPLENDEFYNVYADEHMHIVFYKMCLDDETLTALRLFLTMNNIVYTETFE